jgi:hypothetical protein
MLRAACFIIKVRRIFFLAGVMVAVIAAAFYFRPDLFGAKTNTPVPSSFPPSSAARFDGKPTIKQYRIGIPPADFAHELVPAKCYSSLSVRAALYVSGARQYTASCLMLSSASEISGFYAKALANNRWVPESPVKLGNLSIIKAKRGNENVLMTYSLQSGGEIRLNIVYTDPDALNSRVP